MADTKPMTCINCGAKGHGPAAARVYLCDRCRATDPSGHDDEDLEAFADVCESMGIPLEDEE